MGLKKLSTSCRDCGVEWLEDLSNKVPKRALCWECKLKWDSEYQSKFKEKAKLTAGVSKRVKKDPYKMKNRTPFWQELRTKLKGMKSRKEWLPFIQNRLEEIINDKQLMDYLNDTENADYTK